MTTTPTRSTTQSAAALAATAVHIEYGPQVAVQSLSVEIAAGQIVSLLGPNGAGKTSLLMALTGMLKPSRGTVRVAGHPAPGGRTSWFIDNGVVLVPEGIRNFAALTVLENLQLPVPRRRRGQTGSLLRDVFDLFPVLQDRREQRAGTLSGGEQKMLAIARGLMAQPRVLCIDEPTLGLAPVVIQRIREVLTALGPRGITLLIAEQSLPFVEALGGRVLVIDRGACVWDGDASALRATDTAQAALLGRGVSRSSSR